MRKFLMLLLVLCLAAAPVLAETTAFDFGDFTMSFPSDANGNIADEITDGAAFFIIYQDVEEGAQFTPNLNITWSESYEDLTAATPEENATSIATSAAAALEGQGIKVANTQVVGASMDEIGGKPALSVVYSVDVDYTAVGLDLQTTLYCVQGIVSEEALGTYTFTITTNDMTTVQPLMDIINTVQWAK